LRYTSTGVVPLFPYGGFDRKISQHPRQNEVAWGFPSQVIPGYRGYIKWYIDPTIGSIPYQGITAINNVSPCFRPSSTMA